jgi:muramoyltetrapeptide carboxypeptidase LdcA involved in peptidoglycan recycling
MIKATYVNISDTSKQALGRAKVGKKYLEKHGLSVDFNSKSLKFNGKILRRSAEERAKEFNKAVKTSDLIISTNGGFFNIEMLPLIDYAAAKKHKPFLSGFSDPIHLIYALYKKSGLVSLYGSFLKTSPRDERLVLKSIVANKSVEFSHGSKYDFVRAGKGYGPLVVGADICLYNMFLSEYGFSNKGKIIYLESHYHPSIKDLLYAMLVAKNAGFFDGITGLIFGPQLLGSKKGLNKRDVLIIEVLAIFKGTSFPIAVIKNINKKYTHILPFGGVASLDSKKGEFKVVIPGRGKK